MEENNELQDSQTPDDTSEETGQEENVEQPQEDIVPKKEFDKVYARARKAEETLKKYKELGSEPTKEKPVDDKTKETPDVFDSVADNLSVLRNLSDDEVKEMRVQAKELGIHPVSFIKSRAGQAYLGSFRQEQKVARATPAPTNRGNTAKEVKEYDKMGRDEKEAAYGFQAWKNKRTSQS